MYKDGTAPRHQAVVQPRQIPSSGSQPTIASPSRTTLSSVPISSSNPSKTWTPHAVFSTATSPVALGDDLCTAGLPAGGVIEVNATYTLYLEEAVPYVGPCSNASIFAGTSSNSTVVQDMEPFYASTSPQVYALATATVISYVLVILIFITPRTFYVGGPSGGAGTTGPGIGLRTLFPGNSGRGSSVIGIGRRPLLQKIAALTVAVSLTIATADTFRVASDQYDHGYALAKELVQRVVGSEEIRITRVISDTFLWLAQVQTLIRLFPRHKEKVTIKWLGFGLVLLDSVFSILENFVSNTSKTRPYSFTDAIPALSYLFELSISLIYASCVLYYALSKRRFAFWHAKMRNVCLVALISISAVIIPVVFFILDLAQPDIAVWGEYIRWVGAAAASVVVWEWVERIEALERDEKKDGILGREIFDGDEMLDMTPSEDGYGEDQRGHPSGAREKKRSRFWQNVKELKFDVQPSIPLKKWKRKKELATGEKQADTISGQHSQTAENSITRPPQAITPISRSDTNSAASTVYAVRYHDPFSPSPAIPEDRVVDSRRDSVPANALPAISDESTLTNSTSNSGDQRKSSQVEQSEAVSSGRQIWKGVSNPFKRKRTEPPAEVAAQIANSNARRSPIDGHLNLKGRFNAFTTAQKAKLVGRSQKNRTPLGVTYIPAQPRASRANINSDNTDLNTEAAATATAPGIIEDDESSIESEGGSLNLANIPVTVIPAPVRGGRTWSPDDLVHGQSMVPPTPYNTTPDIRFSQHSPDSTLNPDPPAMLHTQRGALTISEPPGRFRATSSASNGTPTGLRRPWNNHSAIVTSMSDRSGGAQSTTMSTSVGLEPAITESARPQRPPTSNDLGQQTPEE